LGGGTTLRQLSDFKDEALVNGVLALVRRYRPLHVSIVGGEPLVRYRELDVLLPKLDQMNIEVQLVTSAVREIPAHWAALNCLHLVISIDGLAKEHDQRRAPATYERILRHMAGHSVIVHCTITRQLLSRPGYLDEFAAFWSDRPEVRKIWFSLFTPQEGGQYEERLTAQERVATVQELAAVAARFPKVQMPKEALAGFLRPPTSPAECIFAQNTACFSADLTTPITPCQFGGRPVCSECGCLASAGLNVIGQYRIGGLVSVSDVFALSQRIGERVGRSRAAEREPALTPGS
jgi:organic radical activating enzyme